MSKTTIEKCEAVQKLAEVDTRETVSCSLFAGSLYDGDISGETVVVSSRLSSELSNSVQALGKSVKRRESLEKLQMQWWNFIVLVWLME